MEYQCDWGFTEYAHRQRLGLQQRRSFTQTDMDTAASVGLIGQTVVDNLFEPGEEPVGATIRLKNVPIRVIGVLSPKGQSPSGSDQDDVVMIPFSTAERKVLGTSFLGSVGGVFASTDRAEDVFDAVDQIREVLRSRHRIQGTDLMTSLFVPRLMWQKFRRGPVRH